MFQAEYKMLYWPYLIYSVWQSCEVGYDYPHFTDEGTEGHRD